ncbi:hypothetical protein SNE40_000094 [Patella caerulea]|uniref:Receptor ligand binding region domain-containing protein n=1 Tax=Patella caerulea TaxID=87958 RepID=A0AAN8KKC3_PATCE
MLASRHCHMRSKYFWQCYVLCGVLLGLCGNPCAAVKYHIGTYLAESCAIDFTQSVNDTVQRALNVLNERSIATSVDFTHTVFSYCDEATALANIEYVFGGSGHDAVIGIATYPFHNSFAAFSDVYKKPYIASNSFVWTHVTDYAFSSSNSYHQTAVVLGQILDYFKWQGVVSITTDDAYWYDLTTELYIQLNLMNFNMKKNVAFKSPLTHEKATRVLSAIETSEKGKNNFIPYDFDYNKKNP